MKGFEGTQGPLSTQGPGKQESSQSRLQFQPVAVLSLTCDLWPSRGDDSGKLLLFSSLLLYSIVAFLQKEVSGTSEFHLMTFLKSLGSTGDYMFLFMNERWRHLICLQREIENSIRI